MPKRIRFPADKEKLILGLGGVALLAILIGSFLHGPARKEPPLPRTAPKKVAAPMPSFPKGRGKIAIVLDDWGYNLRQVPALAALRRPVTVAILPNLAYSSRVANAAAASGHQVILHMPMEAQSPSAPRERGTILTAMSDPEILKQLDDSLRSVPFAKGFSNHQGSKATADRHVMEVVLKEARKRNLYFLDSLVTDRSVGQELSRELQVRYARRQVFLDNSSSRGSIRKSLMELARRAAKEGEALGIGHDRPNTLEVLQEALPELEAAGYTIVAASELAQVPSKVVS